MTSISDDTPCPCRSGTPYAGCCAPAHGGMPAATAEALMRSRYAAFTLRLEPYLYATWHESTRPGGLRLITDNPTWLGLEVKRASTDGDTAEVEFVAKYRIGGGSVVRMHETSRFVREGGRWTYVDGTHHSK